jgi:CRP/FNR family transcriptional regulator, cyclic AMP receptor protein
MTRLEPDVHNHDPLVGCRLFDGLSAVQRARIVALLTERTLESGATIVVEGDPSAELIVIQRGSIDVTKRSADGARDQRLATLGPGASLGEMTLLERTPRSATARAVGPAQVGILSMDALEELTRSEPGIERQLLRNLSNELSRRLRFTNQTTVAALEQQLALERTRAMMGRFLVFMAFLMVTYTCALYVAIKLVPGGSTPSLITVPISFVWAGVLYGMIRRSGLPLAEFGLTLENWRATLREALVWTALICTGATLVKLGLIWGNASFADQRLFNLSGALDPRTSRADLQATLLIALLYAGVAPVQEFIVRSGLQAALERCVLGRWASLRAIVISNALFASAHLHLSPSFALFVFFPGLLWGALFSRQQNLLGVCVSHLLTGWFAFLALGFDPWY